MLAIDNIKIKYSQEGYLPNYPPHLISDEEMCQAFLTNDVSYFKDMYVLRDESLKSAEDTLINAFKYHIVRFLSDISGFKQDLPNWVYSYMLGYVINDYSDQEDRHYILVGLNRDNIDDILTAEYQSECYKVSQKWVNKLNKLEKVVNLDTLLKDFDATTSTRIKNEFDNWGVVFDSDNNIVIRPPSMHGEQNIVKLIRLGQVS